MTADLFATLDPADLTTTDTATLTAARDASAPTTLFDLAGDSHHAYARCPACSRRVPARRAIVATCRSCWTAGYRANQLDLGGQ